MLNDILTLGQQWLNNRSDYQPISLLWYQAWPSNNYEWFPWSICNGCGMPAGNAYPLRTPGSGHFFRGLHMIWLLRPHFSGLHRFRDRTEHDIHRIMRGFHEAFATVVTCQQGALTLPDTRFRPPVLGLACVPIVETGLPKLTCLYTNFHLEYPLVLSRFCLKDEDFLSLKQFSNCLGI